MSNSFRDSLRASSMIGGSQVVTVLATLVKMKVAALVLGPAGVGLVGLYANLISAAGSISAIGIGTTGVRQIVKSEAAGDELATAHTRRAMFWGGLALAASSGLAFWVLSDWIAQDILSDESRSGDVRWLSIGVALTVAAAFQVALLTGLRRIADLARVNVAAGILGAVIGLLGLWVWPSHGVLVLALTPPLLSFLLGRLAIAYIGKPVGPRTQIGSLVTEWRAMALPGIVFMLSGVAALVGQLAVRTMIQRELGTDSLGYFQASWSISVTYLGFVLVAMGTDYFPRLTGIITDRIAAVKLINEQTEVSLLLCAPVILGLLSLSPWLISLLYSADFHPAIEVLRWQLVGDVFKVMSWPLGFILLAKGRGGVFLATEVFGATLFAALVFIGLPRMGLPATGAAFLVGYIVYLPIVWWLGRRWLGFRWTGAVRFQALCLIFAVIVVDLACRKSELLGLALGVPMAALSAALALVRLSSLAGSSGRLNKLATLGEGIKRWTFRKR